MPRIPILMPQLGESIAEATVVRILVLAGQDVQADQDVLEVETNKATLNVVSPCSGRVEELLIQANESYQVGEVLGYLEVTEEAAAKSGLVPAAAPPEKRHPAENGQPLAPDPSKHGVQPTIRGLPVPASATGAGYMTPRMKALMTEYGLHAADLAAVAGS